MNRRQTDSLDTNAFAKTCVLLDNAKMRDSLTACENECVALRDRIKALESLLAMAGDWIINSTDYNELDPDPLIAEIDAILPDTEVDKNA